MTPNPNRIEALHSEAGSIYFDYHGWHARLQAVSTSLLRVTVTATNWPAHPSVPAAPAVEKHADETVATGGAGQRFEAPIVTATANWPLTLTAANTVTLGDYTVSISAAGLTVNRGEQWVLTQSLPQLTATAWTTRIKTAPAAHFFGGGMQNGQVDLTGRLVQIKNENRWTKGSVSSPVPFYWTTSGYGVLVNSFTPGAYDFGDPLHGSYLTHDDATFDAYLVLGRTPQALLQGYYALTGAPVRLPRFAFYPAHFNAYNRDYWVPVTADSAGARRFPDGQWYKEYQPLNKATFNLGYRPGTITVAGQPLVPNVAGDGHVTFTDPDATGMPKTAIHESLNGEHDPQFSARAIIDQYAAHHLPLGWLIPNDGYGAGYGQTTSLAGDVANLKHFTDYATSRGVAVGLWTQANLHPQDPAHPKKAERDLPQELAAGIRAVKTDVAWVGEGYTFGLNATTQIAKALAARNLRPMIVTLDGWAGTQRTAVVWTGDQAGSDWVNLRTHIGSYLAAGLSGQPHVASDVDGIYGGGDPVVQTRDLQWKAFTPTFFAMDGWGTQPKVMGMDLPDPYQAIDRAFLQFHTTLVPYLYSLAAQGETTGAPLLRPTFWHALEALTAGELATQFMLGDALLVAPIVSPYRQTASGAATRPTVYLPAGDWHDFWTGAAVPGGRMLTEVTAPLTQLPVYVKAGTLLPLALPHANPSQQPATRVFEYWPGATGNATLVEDDGASLAYQAGAEARTQLTATTTKAQVQISIAPTIGTYAGQQASVPVRLFVAGMTAKKVTALSGDQPVTCTVHQGPRLVDPLAPARRESGVTIDIPAVSIREPLTVTVTA